VHRFELPSSRLAELYTFTMVDAHLEKNTTSLHEDLKSDNTHTVAEHGHAATDMYDFAAAQLLSELNTH
jgi:hypothetical protein